MEYILEIQENSQAQVVLKKTTGAVEDIYEISVDVNEVVGTRACGLQKKLGHGCADGNKLSAFEYMTTKGIRLE